MGQGWPIGFGLSGDGAGLFVSVGGFVGLLGNGFEVKVAVFETNVRGTVETDFDEDGIFGTDSDGLVLVDLKELIVVTKGKVIGQGSFGAKGEDFVEPV